MHFLCLHGMGTNSQILETTTATIRYEMDHIHTFDFPEGCVDCPIAPDINGFYPPEDRYYQYYDAHSAAGLSHALAQLGRYIQEEGPFDGVLGFSQGATLAATYLARLSRDRPSQPLPFRCAIFLSGGIPFDPQALSHDEIKLLDPKATELLLRLPTAHIWGRNDSVWPGSSEVLCVLCQDSYKNVYIHDEGHSIPGPREETVQGCVRVIRRVIDQAELLQ